MCSQRHELALAYDAIRNGRKYFEANGLMSLLRDLDARLSRVERELEWLSALEQHEVT